MTFRYFDAGGRQITPEQLQAMQVLTPVMDHVFATVLERVEKSGRGEGPVDPAQPRMV